MKINQDKIRNELYKKFTPNEVWSDKDFNNMYITTKYNLSIIVPVYNVEKYIEQCVESIFNQKTKYTYEVIFIDNGSEDQSSEIIKRMTEGKKHIKHIKQEIAGLSIARNTGINNSEGEYVAFIDSDDYIANDYIEKLLNQAYEGNYDMVKGSYCEFNSDNNSTTKKIIFNNQIIEKDNLSELHNIKGHAWGSVIKKEIFDNIRFPVGYWYEDMVMKMLVMPKCNKIKITEDVVYYYRINYNGLSRKVQKQKSYKCLEQFYLFEKLLKKYKELNLPNQEYMYYNMLHELGTVLWLRTRKIEKDDRKNIFKLACWTYASYDLCVPKHTKKIKNKIISFALKKQVYLLWNFSAIINMIIIKYF